MSRPPRKYVIPSRDAVVTTGEMIVVPPEYDRTGNAMNPAPFVEVVRGRLTPADKPVDGTGETPPAPSE